LDSKLKFSFFF